MSDSFLALAHWPVHNKNREVIASALTTIDMHDLARSAATYGLAGFFVVTPVEDQLRVAGEMLDHWRLGWGAAYNSTRREALGLVHLTKNLGETAAAIESRCGRPPLMIGTSAAPGPGRASFGEVKKLMAGDRPSCLVLGTAWGLTPEAMDDFDLLLEPIIGPTKYNHLSVRSAAGIILDRLFGQR
ncbi:MAG: RNA methyltransferase [Pseudomonadota bacterium]